MSEKVLSLFKKFKSMLRDNIPNSIYEEVLALSEVEKRHLQAMIWEDYFTRTGRIKDRIHDNDV